MDKKDVEITHLKARVTQLEAANKELQAEKDETLYRIISEDVKMVAEDEKIKLTNDQRIRIEKWITKDFSFENDYNQIRDIIEEVVGIE
jgi:hypothetical protein